MTTITVGPNTPIDMVDPFDVFDFNNSFITNFTSTSATSVLGNDTWLVHGSGFSSNPSKLANATVTSITHTTPTTSLTLSGFSLKFGVIASYLIYNDAANLSALIFNGDDNITGGALSDHLVGYAGNDILNGAAGADIIEGGAGNDVLDGGDGVDTITYASAVAGVAVSLAAGGQQNTGGDGLDTVSNFENVTGSAYNDTLTGDGGANIIDGGAGADNMTGGGGNDSFYVDDAGDAVSESADAGHDQVFAAVSYTLGADVEDLTLIGSGAINATGNALDNVLIGNSAANFFIGGGGNDVIDGAGGVDTLSFAAADAGVTVSLALTSQQDTIGYGLYTISNIENLKGTAFADTLTGNSANNVIDGGGGIDNLDGGGGTDRFGVIVSSNADAAYSTSVLLSASGFTFADGAHVSNFEQFDLTAGGGDDQLTIDTDISGVNAFNGGAGNDRLIVDVSAYFYHIVQFDATTTSVLTILNGYNDAVLATVSVAGVESYALTGQFGADYMRGGSGNDVFIGGEGADTLIGGAGDDVLNGGSGVDSTSYADATSGVSVSLLATGQQDTGGGGRDTLTSIENVTGSAFDDVLTGNSSDSMLEGGAGDDTLHIGAALYTNATGGVTVDLNQSGPQAVGGGQGVDTLISIYSVTGSSYNDVLTGNDSVNTLRGGAGNDIIDGRGGADWMYGGDGSDTFIVDDINDHVWEDFSSAQPDTVISSVSFTLSDRVEILTLTGSANIDGTGSGDANTIYGNSGDNILIGENGADSIYGGAGNDTLIGGPALYGEYIDTYWIDYLEGGMGDDTYIVDLGDIAVEMANGGMDTVLSKGSFTLGDNFENLTLIGNGFNVHGTGNALANVMRGDNNNSLDILNGKGGDDTYYVGAGDTVSEAANNGVDIVFSSVSFALGANIENLTLTGSAAINGTGNDLANVIIGNANNNMIDGGGGADSMTGGAGDDTYYVTAGDIITELDAEGADSVFSSASYALGNYIENLSLTGAAAINGTGNALNNILTGNSGANVLTGLGGDDTYIVGSGDTIVEASSEGVDTVRSSATFTLSANIENLTLLGAVAINGTGNNENNVITGNDGDNILQGKGGDDTLDGGAGNDTASYADAAGAVTVSLAIAGPQAVGSGEGSDILISIERLTGSAFGDTLTGNSGINTLDGGAGDDRLDGNGGGDALIGGLGNDTFIVHSGDVITEAANGGTDTVESDITFVLAANLENLTLTGSSAFDATGNALANVLRGNSGVNKLSGLGGNDTYYVGAGDIVIELAGKSGGVDLVQSSDSFVLGDFIENLTLLAGAGNINATGNGLANVLTGNEGDNVLTGLAGNDTLNGGAGHDTLDGGVGIDVMTGGDGDDIYVVDSAKDRVIEAAGLGSGADTIISSITLALNTAALANVENLTLTGNTALNATGNALNNILTGNDGDNVLKGGAGDDTLDGGLGNDTADYTAATSGVSVNLTIGGPQLISALEGSDTLLNIERIIGSNYNDVLTGDGAANVLTGNGGDDVLDGGAGVDVLNGGAGNDAYYVDDTLDVASDVKKNGGIDIVFSSATYTLSAYIENLTLTGALAIDGTGNTLANILTGNAGANVLSGGAGNDTYIVGTGDSVIEIAGKSGGIDLVQSSDSFVLGDFIENLTLTGLLDIDGTGNGLANILRGNAGINHLSGGDGADTYYVDANDFVIEASAAGGVDIVYASGSFTLGANVENLTLLAGAGNIDATGNELANILVGNEGNNRLDGGAGIDTMTGGLGDDTYVVDSLSDKIVESAALSGGIDTIESSITYSIAAKAYAGIENLTLTGTGDFNATGNALNNTLTGNSGANILDGGAGDDALNGGDGDDALIGGVGSDTLTGGLGADDFVLNAAANALIYDTIADFDHGVDQIQLENAVFKALTITGALAADQFYLAGSVDPQTAAQHIIYDAVTGALSYDADGSGAGAAIQIAALAPALAIDHTDFLVI